MQRVCIDGTLSSDFCVELGVRQCSILSPILFLLVMNPLLMKLQASGLDLSTIHFYAGGFLHADDICTLATSESVLSAQVSKVREFAAANFLKLNCIKFEIVVFSRAPIYFCKPQ